VSQWENIDWTKWRAQTQQVHNFRDASEAVLAILEGQFNDAKAASPRLHDIITPCDAALARAEKAHSDVETPAKADLDQISAMFRSVSAFAEEGRKEFTSADYYDFFRNGEYWETSVPQQASFREELIKGLKDMESEIDATPGKK
jgi:hypothetical protein